MKNCCILTVAKEEYEFSPIWYNYYSKFFDNKDMYCLDNGGNILKQYGVNTEPGNIDKLNMSTHEALKYIVQNKIQKLLLEYKCCVFTEIDEFIVANPDVYPMFINILDIGNVRCTGYNVVQSMNEFSYDNTVPILQQRKKWSRTTQYDKTNILHTPVIYQSGFHTCNLNIQPNPNIYLIHLHYFDLNILHTKLKRTRQWVWRNESINTGIQNKADDTYIANIVSKLIHNSENIPLNIKNLL